MSQFFDDIPAQYAALKPFLEAHLLPPVPYIKIQAGEEVGRLTDVTVEDPLTLWQSKIGGHPYFPKTMEYPVDSVTGKAMPLLMQINCRDVPKIEGFDFPEQGILQFYLGFEPADAYCNPDKYRVIYFPDVSTSEQDLLTDFSFVENLKTIREIYPKIYPLEFAVAHDLFLDHRHPSATDAPEALVDLYEEFYETWLSDYMYDNHTASQGNKLGGYVDLHADTDEISEDANGRLLLEFYHPFSCDDSFLFFIPDNHLRDRNFSQVEFYYVCD